ncbi:MAG: GTP-binding protein [Bacteroidales bacterium]|jgi:sulfate adenylyltransferase subunit 1|nr:GTP-binding protein [Bacteroidales bacterium]
MTAGSVDDGKSTLIGRLLYDSKFIFEDQMAHLVESSKRLGKESIDLSLLTDGLRAEREQGITIDVAYRHFSTPSRKFIIADTPGHVQYTRNMVTGASTADLAVMLIDARNGMLEQTIRHSFIAALLDIRHFIFCINKMDLVDHSEEVFMKIRNDLLSMAEKLKIKDLHFIPISAKFGDNVVKVSENMKWHRGRTFLDLIESIEIDRENKFHQARFPVQTVIRPYSSDNKDYRGYAGRVAGGSFQKGDEIIALPSMLRSRIKNINDSEKSIEKAVTGDSVSITLEDPVDISRGDMIVKPGEVPQSGQNISLMICWFNERALKLGGRYLIRTNTNETSCIVRSVNYRINMHTLEKDTKSKSTKMNDISNITIHTAKPIFYDAYIYNSITGSMIFIDEGTNETVAAGMIMPG